MESERTVLSMNSDNNATVIIVAVVIAIGISLVLTFPVMWLWNWLVPSIFHGPELSFWQMYGLLFLINLIFPNKNWKSE